MKKSKKFITAASFVVAASGCAPLISMVGCSKPNDQTKLTIGFVTSGGSKVDAITVVKGSKATKPADPTKDYCKFMGWYTDEECTKAFDWNAPVTENLILFAKWDWEDTPTLEFNVAKTKQVYAYKEKLDLTGLVVEIVYPDKTRKTLEKGQYTSDPAEGTEMVVAGSNEITITTNILGSEPISNSFNVQVGTGLTEVTFAPKAGVDLSNFKVGDTLTCNHFTATGKLSDGTETKITDFKMTVNGTECESYEFTKEEDVSVYLTYQSFYKLFTCTSKYDAQGLVVSTPSRFALPFFKDTAATDNKSYESSKQITVYDKFGAKITRGLEYEVVAGGSGAIAVDEYGLITTKGKAGEDTVKVTYNDEPICQLTVQTVAGQGEVDFRWSVIYDPYVYFGDYVRYTDGDTIDNNCVVPDYLVHEGTNYAPYIQAPEVATNVTSQKDIRSLYLPNTFSGAERYAFSTSSKLRHIYFEGTKEDFENTDYVTLDTNWFGSMVMTVKCYENNGESFTDATHSVRTTIQQKGWQEDIYSTLVGTTVVDPDEHAARYSQLVELDFSKFPIGTDYDTQIMYSNDIIVNHADDADITVSQLELQTLDNDGKVTGYRTLTLNTDYTIKNYLGDKREYGIIHLNLETVELNRNTRLLLNVKSEWNRKDEAGKTVGSEIYCVPNAMVELSPRFLSTFKFGGTQAEPTLPVFKADVTPSVPSADIDTIYGVLADGTEFKIPYNNWFDDDGECLFTFKVGDVPIKLQHGKEKGDNFTQEDFWDIYNAYYKKLVVINDYTGAKGECDLRFAINGNYKTAIFDLNDGSDPKSIDYPEGWYIGEPSTQPTRSGHKFEGWYAESTCTTKFDFTVAHDHNTKVYAKWTKI